MLTKIRSPFQVWVSAAAQNFNSIGIAFGSLIAFASYNKLDNNIVLDTWAICLTNSFTSLLSGMIVFSTLGNIALEQGKDIDDVVAQGRNSFAPFLFIYLFIRTLSLFIVWSGDQLEFCRELHSSKLKKY